jgi:hypothetical protein
MRSCRYRIVHSVSGQYLRHFHKYLVDLICLVAISFTKKNRRGFLHPGLGLASHQPYSRTYRSVYQTSDLAAMSDIDGTTNDDTTSMSTVLDGNILESRHRLTHMDCPDFQIFLTVCFLAKEDRTGIVTEISALRSL